MTFEEVRIQAKSRLGDKCKACPVCNGKACGNSIPGPGSKGIGDTAMRNYSKWLDIRVNMDTISDVTAPDASLEIFGKKFRFPFFAGPVGAVVSHYGDQHNDKSYNNILVKACAEAGIAAFTGDGLDSTVMEVACEAIAAANGKGVPTVKPWNLETIETKMRTVKASGAFAVAMDIDAAGLPFLKGMNPPAGAKSTEQLAEIARMSGKPFIVKGIMTVRGALKAREAGAAAIVVSNHGGRVLDQCPATAEVLCEIADALKGTGMKIFVDGGIRTGVDVFKALAMGADAAIICRPFVPMVYGGGEEGVRLYIDRIGAELEDTMAMCGAATLADIRRDMIFTR